MKKFAFFPAIILLVWAHGVLAFEVPTRPTSFVNDYANVLTAEDKVNLENKISNFEKETSNEIAVVITPSLDGDAVENVAQNIFTKWGIGKADKDNGVLLLVALEEHKTRIQTGYGVEGALTDLATSYIQSEVMTPAFREENYYAGIDGAVDEMIQALGGENIVPESYGDSGIDYGAILAPILFLIPYLAAMFGRSKSWWAGGVAGGAVGGFLWAFSVINSVFIFSIFIAVGLLFDYIVSRSYQKAKASGARYPWWIGGGRGGGFGGGGFGGFGGGHSGGGGSSGSW